MRTALKLKAAVTAETKKEEARIQQSNVSEATSAVKQEEGGGGRGGGVCVWGGGLSGKVILNFCPEMIFFVFAINIYLIPLLALLDLTV